MKALVVGSGAREHALAMQYYGSRRNSGLFCLPGNAGTAEYAINLPGDPRDAATVRAACVEFGIDLVMIGPEGPLALGVADALRAAGIAVFGPGAASARLESSKSFARSFQERHGIPCARTERFSGKPDFERWLAGSEGKVVLKKSGLAAGKGVLESDDPGELLAFGRSVLGDDELLAEEFLTGWELSVFCVSDGERHITMPACADHKKAFAVDLGPNTGGMGAICPVPLADRAAMDAISREIVEPTYRGLAAEGLDYRGVLFFGVMMTAAGPKLLEYNVRFGDPETQSLMPLMETDIIDLTEAAASGSLEGFRLSFRDKATVGFVVAAPGYPGDHPLGIPVRSLPACGEGSRLYHASTTRDADGTLRTGGGRCFTAVALGADYFEAYAAARELAQGVDFEGAWFRPDIGRKFLGS